MIGEAMRKARGSTWLVWVVLAVAALAIALQLQPDNNLEPPSRRSGTVQP